MDNNFESQKRPDTTSINYSITQIESFANDDPESMRKILLSFVQSSRQNLLNFKQYLQQEDYQSLSEIAHKMRPMFRQLEADSIAQILEKLELKNMSKLRKPERKKNCLLLISEIENLLEIIETNHLHSTN